MRVLPDTIFRYRPEINKKELVIIGDLYRQIWNKLAEEEPDGFDEEIPDNDIKEETKEQFPVYLRNGVKIAKYNTGIEVLLTNTEPFQPVYHKWMLELILKNV